ncbi:ArsR/SmtB family transcription factor [Actinomadura formosensis]|uniref:ArsR/SmtB family transcription factor n=1 Tax=Actinomadura formosensis TaxID=60706 RepID=UPI00082AEF2A|nr:metalloregulator ArsR/SmtB family transcription factor [Actinomadura formosensis]
MSKQQLPIVNSGVVAGDGDGTCCAPLVCEPLSQAEAAELAPLFKAIADPVRLRLLSLIACHEGGEACVCDLTAAFDLTAPTISHHLKVLKQAGLIDSERRGTWVYYWLNPGVLERLSAILGPRAAAAAASAAAS